MAVVAARISLLHVVSWHCNIFLKLLGCSVWDVLHVWNALMLYSLAWAEDKKVHFYVSPFQRTLQTAPWIESEAHKHTASHSNRCASLAPVTTLHRGKEYHFLEFRSRSSRPRLRWSTDSGTRIWKFTRRSSRDLAGFRGWTNWASLVPNSRIFQIWLWLD